MRWLGLVAVAFLSISFSPELAHAFPDYGADIPNGRVSSGSPGSYSNTRCWLCHSSAKGGYQCPVGGNSCLNPFGIAFQGNNYVWNRVLAAMDSDDDGFTNGQELREEWGASINHGSVYYTLPGNPTLNCNDIPTGSPWGSLRTTCSSEMTLANYSSRATAGRREHLESYYDPCALSSRNDCESQASCSRNAANGRGDWSCSCGISYTGDGHDLTRYHDWDAPNATLGDSRLFEIRSSSVVGCVSKCVGAPCGTNGSCSLSGSSPGYTCNCASGYRFNGSTCVVDNECSTDPGRCDPGTCNELSPPQTFSCTCPAGFLFNGTGCVVSNPCVAGTDDCARQATCTAPGPFRGETYTCECNEGWQGTGTVANGTGDRCVDIDECAQNPRICGPGRCSNTSGGYTCACNAGYQFGRTTCIDIDECAPPADPCGEGGTRCTNAAGSYSCSCGAGYVFMGGTCVDINECATNPCGEGECSQTEPPGYVCTCAGGYEFDGTRCVDIDECATSDLAGCDGGGRARCENSVGGFRCICNDQWQGDGTTCTDRDECAMGLDDCAELTATCTNLEPGYDCECKEHYTGSGLVCTDVNECADGTVRCADNEVCVNQIGAVALCECIAGFQRSETTGDCVNACGDGHRAPGEACDDGNDAAGDGCSPTCDTEPGFSCWEVDGGPSTCENTCGNGFIEAYEECDPGEGNFDDVTPDACRSNCQLGYCGDGVLDTGETCDDGENVSDETPDACRLTGCVAAYCGDGVVDSGETCDTGAPGEPVITGPGACVVCAPRDLGVGDMSTLDMAMGDLGIDSGLEVDTDGGCGCTTPGTSRRSGWLFAMGVALLWVRRRRSC